MSKHETSHSNFLKFLLDLHNGIAMLVFVSARYIFLKRFITIQKDHLQEKKTVRVVAEFENKVPNSFCQSFSTKKIVKACSNVECSKSNEKKQRRKK